MQAFESLAIGRTAKKLSAYAGSISWTDLEIAGQGGLLQHCRQPQLQSASHLVFKLSTNDRFRLYELYSLP